MCTARYLAYQALMRLKRIEACKYVHLILFSFYFCFDSIFPHLQRNKKIPSSVINIQIGLRSVLWNENESRMGNDKVGVKVKSFRSECMGNQGKLYLWTLLDLNCKWIFSHWSEREISRFFLLKFSIHGNRNFLIVSFWRFSHEQNLLK